MRSLLNLSILLILFSSLLTGCAKSTQMKQIFVDGQERIQLRYQVTEVDGKEQIIEQGYNHPAQLSVESLEALLKDVSINKYELLHWSDPQPLFYDEEVVKLAPRLSDAFKQASSNQWIYFSITAEKPGLLTDTLRMTDGICYLEKDNLNLVINNINVEIFGQNTIASHELANRLKKRDPRIQPPDRIYRFVFTPEKSYRKPPVIEGDKWLSKEQFQWLVFDLKSSFSGEGTAEQTSITAGPGAKEGIKERLKKLKEIHEQELISDQEYEDKRKAILEEL